MEHIRTIVPILITKTRSFWLGILPAALTLLDMLIGEATAGDGPISQMIAAVTGWTPEQISSFLLALAPIYALIVAHQRSGLSRPYTLTPEKERKVAEAVENGKTAFDAGLAEGAAK